MKLSNNPFFYVTVNRIIQHGDAEINRLREMVPLEKEVYERRMGENWLERAIAESERLKKQEASK